MSAPNAAPVAVEFECELRQIKTMADGSVNVTLNLPEYCMPHVKAMMDWLNCALHVVAAYVGEAEEPETRPDDWGGKPDNWK